MSPPCVIPERRASRLFFWEVSVARSEDPEVIRTTMQYQGISTKMFDENSLMLDGRGKILGGPHCALKD